MKSIKENAIYNTAYQIVALFTPVITTPYLSRVLGAEKIGDFTYTMSISSFFILFAMLGINDYGNKIIASVRNNKDKLSNSFWQLYYIQLFLSIIMIIFYCVFIFWFADGCYLVLFVIQGVRVISVITDINWFAYGVEEFKFTTIRNFIVKILSIGLIFVLVKNENDIWKYTLIMALSNTFGLFAIWKLVKKYTHFVKPDLKEIIYHLKPNLVLFVPLLLSTGYSSINKILIGDIINNENLGLYYYSENIINFPMGIIIAICTTLAPRISNLIYENKEVDADNLVKITCILTFVLDIAICIGIFSISDIFVPLYFGESFFEATEYVKLLSLTIPFVGVGYVIKMLDLIPNSLNRIYVLSIFIGSLLNIILDVILIPKFGGFGACVATIIVQFSILLIQLLGARNRNNFIKIFQKMIPYVAFGLVMNFCIKIIGRYLNISWISLLFEIMIGALVYVILSVLWSKKFSSDKCIYKMFIMLLGKKCI